MTNREAPNDPTNVRAVFVELGLLVTWDIDATADKTVINLSREGGEANLKPFEYMGWVSADAAQEYLILDATPSDSNVVKVQAVANPDIYSDGTVFTVEQQEPADDVQPNQAVADELEEIRAALEKLLQEIYRAVGTVTGELDKIQDRVENLAAKLEDSRDGLEESADNKQ